MLRVIRDIVARDQRFATSLGTVVATTQNRLSYADVQVIIADITAEGARQSFDDFICTLMGRAVLAKVADKEGAFVEFVTERDATYQTPPPGVYYFNVNSVDESTRNVELTVQLYKWYEGKVQNAQGTRISFAPGIDATSVVITDPTNNSHPGVLRGASFLYLLAPVNGLAITTATGTVLRPNTDYWVEQIVSESLVTTASGSQIVVVPAKFITFSITDQTGFVLRSGKDYTITTGNTIVLSSWTPVGSTLTVTGQVKFDPTIVSNLLNPENLLNFSLAPDETLVDDQVFVSSNGNHIQVMPQSGGSVILPFLLSPGGKLRYEARVQTPQTVVEAQKNAMNTALVPGLGIFIGDNVRVGDQCAIIVSPSQTETYRVYGATDNVSFTLEIKANDPSTASRLAELIKHDLLTTRRNQMMSDGVGIQRMGRAQIAEARDSSGTAGRYTATLSVQGTADWRVFIPLVTRVTSFSVSSTISTSPSSFGEATATPYYRVLQATGFMPDYR